MSTTYYRATIVCGYNILSGLPTYIVLTYVYVNTPPRIIIYNPRQIKKNQKKI